MSGQKPLFAAALVVAVAVPTMANATLLLSEDFDGLTLGTQVDETVGGFTGQGVFTHTPPAGWSVTNNINTLTGVTEWKGWSFARKDFWIAAAGDQNRSQFTKGKNNVAVADPDEYDDKGSGILNDGYNTFLKLPTLNVAGMTKVTLTFDSSWRPEGFDDDNGLNNQTATITKSVDGGAKSDILHWDSKVGGQFFHADDTNGTVVIDIILNGNSTLDLEFGLTKANNDWWWAVDNVKVEGVPEPATMSILGLGLLGVLAKRRKK